MATANSVLALVKAYRPSFRNPHDKVAFAVHASLLASGYVLTATGPPAFSDTALSSSSTDDEVGIEGWNATDEEYGFLYRKEDNGVKKSLLVKCLVMGDKLIVDALVVGDGEEKPVNLQIDVDKYDGASESTNYSDMYKNFGELVNSLNSGILGKLDESSASCSSTRSKASGGSEDKPIDQGVGVIGPRGSQPYPAGPVFPQVPPFGETDLVPGGGAGMYPPRGTGIGGGMLIGPNDPRWFGGVDGQPGFPGGAPGVPPGARFDPYGPPGVPGFEPNRFVRNPRRPGGNTHPDLEHFGSGSDFI
ncbi:probable proteasome inhibitor isoform X3 [Telopea speciosissima]|uniref:probable proteasome inhibitor isoform X3 n=1 Tax=Telopea speciosissima TaxID=54955 RepID=UPI001CC49B76|nr:probable proteasome inhibitor isoform X3 [Telopea speciosissima]